MANLPAVTPWRYGNVIRNLPPSPVTPREWDGTHRPQWASPFELSSYGGGHGWSGIRMAPASVSLGESGDWANEAGPADTGGGTDWGDVFSNIFSNVSKSFETYLKYQSPGTYTSGGTVYRQPTGAGNLPVGGGTANLNVGGSGIGVGTLAIVAAVGIGLLLVAKK